MNKINVVLSHFNLQFWKKKISYAGVKWFNQSPYDIKNTFVSKLNLLIL